MMDEQEFRKRSDQALESLNKVLADAGEDYGFEADFNSGALTVEFEDPPARFVVSPNAPVRQIWVSAISRSYKLDWDKERGAFVLPDTGESLQDLVAARLTEQLGEEVSL
jgi:iron donor protein CyaY